MRPYCIHLVVAARPNFMKMAPLWHALSERRSYAVELVHTGQHYDVNMSASFIRELQIPEPRFHLGVGSGPHCAQTGGIMAAYEEVCMHRRPDCIVVAGDVNSTLACALVGAKLGIPVIHLEAGLRSRDRSMPEEINRVVTDHLSELLWTPSSDADDNLLDEGIDPASIERVGNTMIDSLVHMTGAIESDRTRDRLGLRSGSYGLATLHRPTNVDDPETLEVLLGQLSSVSSNIPVVFPVHPRTDKQISRWGYRERLEEDRNLHLSGPLSYLPFMNLLHGAAFVITDSGGLQEETTYLGIPCLTVRDNTERPITISEGTNKLVSPQHLAKMAAAAAAGDWPTGRRPELWDGRAAVRAADSLARFMEGRG